MHTPDIDPRGVGHSILHLTPESIAHSTRSLLGELLGQLDATPGSVEGTGGLSHGRLCCRLLRDKVGSGGQAAVLEIEVGFGALYAKRTPEAKRVELRGKIRQLAAGLRPAELEHSKSLQQRIEPPTHG